MSKDNLITNIDFADTSTPDIPVVVAHTDRLLSVGILVHGMQAYLMHFSEKQKNGAKNPVVFSAPQTRMAIPYSRKRGSLLSEKLNFTPKALDTLLIYQLSLMQAQERSVNIVVYWLAQKLNMPHSQVRQELLDNNVRGFVKDADQHPTTPQVTGLDHERLNLQEELSSQDQMQKLHNAGYIFQVPTIQSILPLLFSRLK